MSGPTIVILTRDEERCIGRCLDSVAGRESVLTPREAEVLRIFDELGVGDRTGAVTTAI